MVPCLTGLRPSMHVQPDSVQTSPRFSATRCAGGIRLPSCSSAAACMSWAITTCHSLLLPGLLCITLSLEYVESFLRPFVAGNPLRRCTWEYAAGKRCCYWTMYTVARQLLYLPSANHPLHKSIGFPTAFSLQQVSSNCSWSLYALYLWLRVCLLSCFSGRIANCVPDHSPPCVVL